MSITFHPPHQNSQNVHPTQETVQKMLEENAQLLQIITECQLRGKMRDCIEYQKVLHRNLVYLAKLTDLSTHAHVSLLTPGNQMGNDPTGQVIQIQPSGQDVNLGQLGNQVCTELQGSFPMQGQNVVSQQPMMSQNEAAFLMLPQSEMGQMSQGSVGQNTNPVMLQQQPMMAQDQHMMPQNHTLSSQHSSSMAQNCMTLSGGSNHVMAMYPVGQQGGHCSAQPGPQYSDQQNYMQQCQQQFNGQQPEQSQYSQSALASTPQQGQCMSSQQDSSSQGYSPYSSHGMINAKDKISHQQGNIGGGQKRALQIGQQSILTNQMGPKAKMNQKQVGIQQGGKQGNVPGQLGGVQDQVSCQHGGMGSQMEGHQSSMHNQIGGEGSQLQYTFESMPILVAGPESHD